MENEKYKVGFVSIIGEPNVGKSTLMNNIIGMKVAITSYKPQTTRYDIKTVFTNDEGQMIFIDTPGIHKTKNKLDKQMMRAVFKSVKGSDVVLWLVEAGKKISESDQKIAEYFKDVNKPVILGINKSDKITADEMLPVIDEYSKLFDFDEIVPLSARTGKNVDRLVSCLFQYLPYGEKLYDDDAVTDQPVRRIVAEIIREKALLLLNEEIPHGIAVVVEKMSTRKNGLTDIDATIICERESHKGIIIGKNGKMLKDIGSRARKDIEELVDGKVNLQIWVKVRKDWRDNDRHIKGFELFVDE